MRAAVRHMPKPPQWNPASHFQPQDVHGPSEVIDHAAYRWRHPDWRGAPWHEMVIYELHVGVCGGFAGVRARLPHLQSLGVTAIELMPIADFPGTRNWGYDGVYPYAPDSAYGRPEELKALIDDAHGAGLSVFLDVVYNHFGPEGNYLAVEAPQFFRDDVQTPWGAAIDFRRREVREFFIGNAIYWLTDYRFDGLRFDAVHAIHSDDFLPELAQRAREKVGAERHVHLVLENERNEVKHLVPSPACGRGPGRGSLFAAQWHDQFHNALHVLLTGEREGYYERFAEAPAAKLAQALAGLRTSGDVPPTALIAFLQNHDQVGNRAFGERLIALTNPRALRAATVLLLLSPQIPLLFMGEEWGCRTPFLFFTDFHDELADAVRSGRRQEFAKFAAFADPDQRARIPDPNDEATFRRSIPDFGQCAAPEHASWLALYRELIALRRREIVPRLPDARSDGATATGDQAVEAGWRLGDGSHLRIAVEFGASPAAVATLDGRVLFDER
jgi:maltooligosyltrehalose trehalohydrolase